MTAYRTHRISSLLASLALLAATGAPVSAQVRIHVFHGDDPYDELGKVVAAAGDVNADGFPDVIAGAPRDSTNGSGSGLARVWSGKDGAVLHTFLGAAASDVFGTTVAGAGDANGDGFDDLIVGARFSPGSGPGAGNAYVFSGLDGSLLHTAVGAPQSDWVIGGVAGVGDLNGDSHDDFLVGEPYEDTGGYNAGRARAYSGADGSVLHEIIGPAAGLHLGWSVDGAGDVNGDGTPDFVLGGTSNAGLGTVGLALVCSGLDGGLLHSLSGATSTDRFGRSVSGAGDVNGDGFDDVLVGASADSTSFSAGGLARVYSGATGQLLYAFSGTGHSEELGIFVSEGGDYDRDGFDDVLVGAKGGPHTFQGTGAAHLLSGADGSLLRRIRSFVPNDSFGWTGGAIGDLDADRRPDYVLGGYSGDVNGPSSGSVYVLSIAPPFTYYCSTNPNSTGSASMISASGHGSNLDNDLVLTADHLPVGGMGIFYCGQGEAEVPFGDGFRCIANPYARMSPGIIALPPGVAWRHVDLNQGLGNLFDPGTTWEFQYWYRDPAAGGSGFNLSNAVSIDFLP